MSPVQLRGVTLDVAPSPAAVLEIAARDRPFSSPSAPTTRAGTNPSHPRSTATSTSPSSTPVLTMSMGGLELITRLSPGDGIVRHVRDGGSPLRSRADPSG